MDQMLTKMREEFDKDDYSREAIKKILSSYKSRKEDWSKFYFYDPHKYTRNLVDTGNGKYNAMILVWPEGIASPIHDHSENDCFVKVLEGELTETRYEWPKNEEEEVDMTEIGRDTYTLNEVTYMCDKIGLHRMENNSNSKPAVTLHVYIPGYQTCQIFDEHTGHKTKCQVTFFTKYGQKVDYKGSKEGTIIKIE
uniref:Cysteine dioxygenase n=1 Tax=Parastrongyloides trichosuri TaxID=131310 RepID=A0A0N4ZGM6_PARTI